jgi:uncharacterized protein YdhG (YjbR/CyaY superfamily)
VTGSPATVDEYVHALPDGPREVLERIRCTIHAVVPDAGERISYAMPTFTLDGRPLVHVAAWKQHVGLYPLPALHGDLAAAVQPYRAATGTMRLRYDRPIPYDLVGQVVQALVDRRS